MLTCDNIACSRWGKMLFKGLGFTLLPGSLLVPVTPDARTKTLLLEVMAGVKNPKSGAVWFEDYPIRGNAGYARYRIYLPRHTTLPDKLSTFDAAAQLSGDEDRRLINAALHYFELDAFADTPIGELPPALKPRVHLTPLLTHPCPLWIIDKPNTPLDDATLSLLYALVAGRCNQEGIVVMGWDNTDFIAPLIAIDLKDFR